MKRCMFVDDSNVIRKVAKRILGGSDLMVIEASSGQEAAHMCEADMPATDLIRRIKSIQSPIVPHIAICLTEVDVPTIMRAKRAGAQSFILKPFNRSQLLERFRAMSAAA